jgi:hypothetical protein
MSTGDHNALVAQHSGSVLVSCLLLLFLTMPGCTRIGFQPATDAALDLPSTDHTEADAVADGGAGDGSAVDRGSADGALPDSGFAEASPPLDAPADLPPAGTSQLSVSPLAHTLAIVQGTNPSDDPLFLRNLSGSSLIVAVQTWRVDRSGACPWIAAVSPASVAMSPNSGFQRLTVSYATSTLAAGSYRCFVEVTADSAPTEPWVVPILLDVKSAPTISYLQSWEQNGCNADGASAFTGVDCDLKDSNALDGSELLQLGYTTSFYADGAVGAISGTRVLYLRVPIYFSSFQGIEMPEIFVLRDGDTDAYPKIAAYPGPDSNNDNLGDNRDLFLRCKPIAPPGDHDTWLGITTPIDRWIVIRLRIDLARGIVLFDDEGSLWDKKGCAGAPLSYADLGYAFRTTWGRTLLIDHLEISDVEFSAPLTLP